LVDTLERSMVVDATLDGLSEGSLRACAPDKLVGATLHWRSYSHKRAVRPRWVLPGREDRLHATSLGPRRG
jgi:hypothetical protein